MEETKYRVTRESGGELKHYGVKGMRWGVRRYQDYNGKRLNSSKSIAQSVRTAVHKAGKVQNLDLPEAKRALGRSDSQAALRDSANKLALRLEFNKTVDDRTLRQMFVDRAMDQYTHDVMGHRVNRTDNELDSHRRKAEQRYKGVTHKNLREYDPSDNIFLDQYLAKKGGVQAVNRYANDEMNSLTNLLLNSRKISRDMLGDFADEKIGSNSTLSSVLSDAIFNEMREELHKRVP